MKNQRTASIYQQLRTPSVHLLYVQGDSEKNHRAFRDLSMNTNDVPFNTLI